jgi:hypothetical protein
MSGFVHGVGADAGQPVLYWCILVSCYIIVFLINRRWKWSDLVDNDLLFFFVEFLKLVIIFALTLDMGAFFHRTCRASPELLSTDRFELIISTDEIVCPARTFSADDVRQYYGDLNFTVSQQDLVIALCSDGTEWSYLQFIIFIELVTMFYFFVNKNRMLKHRHRHCLILLGHTFLWAFYEYFHIYEYAPGYLCEIQLLHMIVRSFASFYSVSAFLCIIADSEKADAKKEDPSVEMNHV